jgi:hypothetical protein
VLKPELTDRLRVASAFLLGLTLPISVSVSEIVSVLGFLVLLAEWRPAENWRQLRTDPVAWAALGLFALLGLGTLYSTAPLLEAVRSWMRYRELLYLPLFMLICRDDKARQAGLQGFFGAIVLILLVGMTTIYRPLAHLVGHVVGRTPYDSAFGSYITEGMLVALAVYFLAIEAIRRPTHRKLAVALLTWGLLYTLFMNTGRTGYVVLLLAAISLVVQMAPRRLWLPGAILILVSAAGLVVFSPRMHERMLGLGHALEQGGGQETVVHKMWPDTTPTGANLTEADPAMARGPDAVAIAAASANTRLEFLRIGSEAMLLHPLIGTGTGSFQRTYATLAAAHHTLPTTNPHNEYILITVQLGAIGLAALLAFFAILWHRTRRLPLWDARRGQVLVLTFAVACLVNSLLMDHKDGHTFAFLVSVFFSGAAAREDQHRRHDL